MNRASRSGTGSVARLSRHAGQSRRMSRCATMPRSADAILYASIPMSTSRVTAFGASLVCSVESTRWPVSDAWSAIWAVSWSRISPMSTTSGSCRRIDRSAEAKVRPGLLVHLHLHDVLAQPVLDRILDGHDVDALALDQPEAE